MNEKVKKAKAVAKKEKAESVAANEALKIAIEEESKEYVALRTLCTSSGMVKKGESFTCSSKEYEIFKKAKAV